MTNANDPANPVMQPTGTYSGMTIREQMALTLTASLIAGGRSRLDACKLGIITADELIIQLNNTTNDH